MIHVGRSQREQVRSTHPNLTLAADIAAARSGSGVVEQIDQRYRPENGGGDGVAAIARQGPV